MLDSTALEVPPETSIGRRFCLARVASGRTQKEMAAALGLSRDTYGLIEADRRAPRRGEVLAAAHVTGQQFEFFGASFDEEGRVLPPPLSGVNQEEGSDAG